MRLGYPFLDAAAPRAPDIVYVPTYFPADARPTLLAISGTREGSVQLEMRSVLGTGGELRVWESTRSGATPTDAVGPFVDDGPLVGALATWHLAHTTEARLNVLYARIGQTLVVISGAVSPEELLRIADSLRRTRASSLQL